MRLHKDGTAPTDGSVFVFGSNAAGYHGGGAARIVRTVASVRAERLQDISNLDAMQEGLTQLSKDGGQTWKWGIAAAMAAQWPQPLRQRNLFDEAA